MSTPEDSLPYGQLVPSDLDASRVADVFVPATRKHYTTWLYGYLMGGGEATFIEEGERNFDTDEEILFAVHSFSLGGEELMQGARKIIVADGVDWDGQVGSNTLFLLQDFQLIGNAPTVVATQELGQAGLGDGLQESFLDSLAGMIRVRSDPGIFDQDSHGVYSQNLQRTLDSYERMAEVLQLEIPPHILDTLLREAQVKRAELLESIGPDYRYRQMEAAHQAILAAYRGQGL